jgi:hypothetical protein
MCIRHEIRNWLYCADTYGYRIPLPPLDIPLGKSFDFNYVKMIVVDMLSHAEYEMEIPFDSVYWVYPQIKESGYAIDDLICIAPEIKQIVKFESHSQGVCITWCLPERKLPQFTVSYKLPRKIYPGETDAIATLREKINHVSHLVYTLELKAEKRALDAVRAKSTPENDLEIQRCNLIAYFDFNLCDYVTGEKCTFDLLYSPYFCINHELYFGNSEEVGKHKTVWSYVVYKLASIPNAMQARIKEMIDILTASNAEYVKKSCNDMITILERDMDKPNAQFVRFLLLQKIERGL